MDEDESRGVLVSDTLEVHVKGTKTRGKEDRARGPDWEGKGGRTGSEERQRGGCDRLLLRLLFSVLADRQGGR